MGAWVFAMAVAFGGLTFYQLLPGVIARDIEPEALCELAAVDQPPLPIKPLATHRLVVFAHPHCPCTNSTIAELSKLMTLCTGRLDASVYFYRPSELEAAWAHTTLWAAAEAIEGVTVAEDLDGHLARRCDASTSGQVLLVDRQGQLLFSGGITSVRGHHGDNDGSAAVIAHVLHGTGPTESPVFGCAMFSTDSQPDTFTRTQQEFFQ